jgi:hypothetical protein
MPSTRLRRPSPVLPIVYSNDAHLLAAESGFPHGHAARVTAADAQIRAVVGKLR